MYNEYVEILAKCASEVFSEMAGKEILGSSVRKEDSISEGLELAHIIEYKHMEKDVDGQFILGFGEKEMAISVAKSIGRNMGLESITELDDITVDLLNEFLNTVVGRTISEWDRNGMSVTFSPSSLFYRRQRGITPPYGQRN